MSVITGFRPFPWPCSDCGSISISIEPLNNPNDPQEIKVLCKQCGREHYTSGEPFFVDLPKNYCRPMNDEERERLVEKFRRATS